MGHRARCGTVSLDFLMDGNLAFPPDCVCVPLVALCLRGWEVMESNHLLLVGLSVFSIITEGESG